MVSSKKNDGVVPVIFRANTSYGSKGSPGYIPESFADAWIAKGIVEPVVKKVTKKPVSVAEEKVVDGEADNTGESRDVKSGEGESVPGDSSEGTGI